MLNFNTSYINTSFNELLINRGFCPKEPQNITVDSYINCTNPGCSYQSHMITTIYNKSVNQSRDEMLYSDGFTETELVINTTKNSTTFISVTINVNQTTDEEAQTEEAPPLTLADKIYSFSSSFFTSGNILSDSLWFFKEITLSTATDGIATVNAYFDLSRTKNVMPNLLYFMGANLCSGYSESNSESSLLSWSALFALANNLIPLDSLDKDILLPLRITLDTSFLGRQAYSYGKAIHLGLKYFRQRGVASPLSIQRATFLVFAGMEGMVSTATHGHNLYQGTRVFSTLDDVQQKAILKHRALHLITTPKNCNAVIIDGLSSSWGDKIMDDISFPMAELLYEKCNTLTYRVSRDTDFCKALQVSKEYFGSSIDILSLQGHANEYFMKLNDGFLFAATAIEKKCMNETLKSEVQVFALGCNTATGDGSFGPLAKRISRGLPSGTVTGFKAYLLPFFATQTYFEDGFSMHAIGFANTKGEYVFENSVVTYQNGEKT